MILSNPHWFSGSMWGSHVKGPEFNPRRQQLSHFFTFPQKMAGNLNWKWWLWKNHHLDGNFFFLFYSRYMSLSLGLFKIITNHSVIFLPCFWLLDLDTCKCIQFDNNWRKWAFTKTLFSQQKKNTYSRATCQKGGRLLLKNLASTQIVNNISKKGLLGGPKKL